MRTAGHQHHEGSAFRCGAVIATPNRNQEPAQQGVQMSWDTVYRLIKKIPRGRVTTYGELARKLRLPGGARAVGYAMAACPSGRGIPWHRVVGAEGRLLISEPHGSLQRRLLEAEGVRTEFGRIDMQRYGWTPGSKRKSSRKRNIRRQH
jgi:methylated-DNA-protein-cysteine methyltransferase-like protein